MKTLIFIVLLTVPALAYAAVGTVSVNVVALSGPHDTPGQPCTQDCNFGYLGHNNLVIIDTGQ